MFLNQSVYNGDVCWCSWLQPGGSRCRADVAACGRPVFIRADPGPDPGRRQQGRGVCGPQDGAFRRRVR